LLQIDFAETDWFEKLKAITVNEMEEQVVFVRDFQDAKTNIKPHLNQQLYSAIYIRLIFLH